MIPIVFFGLTGLAAIPAFLGWFAVATRRAPWTPLSERIAQESNPDLAA